MDVKCTIKTDNRDFKCQSCKHDTFQEISESLYICDKCKREYHNIHERIHYKNYIQTTYKDLI